MTSQLDLDQGGTFRGWVKLFMGPSVGWVMVPGDNVLPITAAGIVTALQGTTLITVSVQGAVTIILPSAINPAVPAGVLPGVFAKNPITIVDTGGFAQANPITIQPASVSETIMGLSQIQITVNYGGFTLEPNSTAATWNSISP